MITKPNKCPHCKDFPLKVDSVVVCVNCGCFWSNDGWHILPGKDCPKDDHQPWSENMVRFMEMLNS